MVLSLRVALRNAVFWRVRGIRPVGDMWPTPSITTTALAQPASPHFVSESESMLRGVASPNFLLRGLMRVAFAAVWRHSGLFRLAALIFFVSSLGFSLM